MSFGILVTIPGASTAFASGDPVFTGQWYGRAVDYTIDSSSYIDIQFNQAGDFAIFHIPAIGLHNQYLPASYDVNEVTAEVPGEDILFTGTLDGNHISGSVWYTGFGFPLEVGDWQVFSALESPPQPGSAPGPMCDDSIPIYCAGDAAHCAEIVPFDPDVGPGYLDYALNGETTDNQYRSFIRRDGMMLTKYAAAKTECKTTDWNYWNFAPVGLGDMSEADGSIPGTSIGRPGHPPYTHEYGSDIDVAYYQLYAFDNLLRSVCSSYEGYYFSAFHCVDPPHGLDPWRTALFISHLSEHPLLRIVYVDWLVGPVLDDALDELVSRGWIDAGHRAAIPLVYYVEGDEEQEYLFHHHHMHVSMNHIYDILTLVDITPDLLNRKSQGKFITAHIELIAGLDVSEIDLSTVALIVDGRTMVPALEGYAEVSDYNSNGIPDLAVKFERISVTETIASGTSELAVIGSIYGYFFQGSDTLKIN